MFSLDDDLQAAYEGVAHAKQFFDSLSESVDPDLMDAAIYELKSAEKFRDWKLRQIRSY